LLVRLAAGSAACVWQKKGAKQGAGCQLRYLSGHAHVVADTDPASGTACQWFRIRHEVGLETVQKQTGVGELGLRATVTVAPPWQCEKRLATVPAGGDIRGLDAALHSEHWRTRLMRCRCGQRAFSSALAAVRAVAKNYTAHCGGAGLAAQTSLHVIDHGIRQAGQVKIGVQVTMMAQRAVGQRRRTSTHLMHGGTLKLCVNSVRLFQCNLEKIS
jgi:hypothetical protein